MNSKSLVVTFLNAILIGSAVAHGPDGRHSGPVVEEDVVGGGQPAAADGSEMSFRTPVDVSRRNWGASLETGWESRHVHYGVDETGNFGAYTTELSVWVGDLALGAWSGFGTGNGYQEWDFTVSYNLEAGPVFLLPGYNFRYNPGADDEHAHAGESGDHDGEEVHDHEHDAHRHRVYNNEFFLVLGTTAIPYVTPSTVFLWNLNESPGGLLEFRLDGEIPIHRDIVTLQPYALLALNFGYNTPDSIGWNNFQFGVEATWRVNRVVSLFAGVNYSIAMTALRSIGQDNVVWANTGVAFSF
jgi:hypothetical protein